MKKTRKVINGNSIPFIVLAFIHICVFFIFTNRRKQRNVWMLFMSNVGFAYLFEYIVFNIFKGYSYKPFIFRNKRFDEVFGAILSQGLYVPITATLITNHKLKWYWKIFLSFLYYLIEKTFIFLRLYKVYWWKPIYTFGFLNGYFYISDVFNKGLLKNKKWALSTAHYLAIMVTGVTLLYISALFRQIKFGWGMFKTWKEHFIIAPLYSFIHSALLMQGSSKMGMKYRLDTMVYVLSLDNILARTKILKINFKKYFGTIPFHFVMIIFSRLLYLKINQKPKTTID